MKKTIFTFYTFLFCTILCNAQITWEKLFVKSNTDVFRSIQEVPAGGYIAAGYTSWFSSNDTDAFVVRLTTDGDTMWTRTFNNSGKKDVLYKVINTSDGGFAFCGYKTTTVSSDAWYIKLDANGNFVWEGFYGGNGTERGQEIIQTADGGYAMCGYTSTSTGAQGFNSFLVKIDASGGQTWSMKYGGNGFDDANSVKELPNGDFVMVGQTVSFGLGGGDVWLVYTNSMGVMQWDETYGTANPDNGDYIQLASSGGFIIAGSTQNISPGDDNGYLIKTDNLGNLQWSKIYGGIQPDDFHRVENTSDGGYIIVGTTQSNAAIISNEWLVKTDDIGDTLWTRTYGRDNHDHGYSAVETSDGGYIMCGYTSSFGYFFENAHVIKLDELGLLHNHMVYTTVTALVSPVSGTCGSANTTVTITVRNWGDTTISIYPDSVVITGAINQTLAQTFNTTIVPPNFTNHTFSTTINTSAGGTFHFHCFTSNNNDVYPAMNSLDTDIILNGQPSDPTVENDTLCGPGDVTLSANSSGSLEWYANSSGGVAINTGTTYTTNISSTTTFYVQAVNACGTSTRIAVTGFVLTPASPPNVFDGGRCGPGDVTLLASAGSPISWWDSATGGMMVEGDVNSYIANVTTTTTFWVEAGTGSPCPSTRVPVTATVNPLPDAAFTPSAPAVCLGDSFQFTNSTTGAVNYFWDFGDATGTSFLPDPSYTYAQTGNYDVRLIAQSDSNCFDSVIVNVGVNTAPQVSFSTATTDVCLPFDVSFNNTTTNATNYLWNFGDGGSSTDEFPIHTYSTEGIYTVTLFATVGSCADSDSVIGMITTHLSPIVDLGPDVSSNSVVYDLDAGPGFSTYLWNNGATTQTITADTNGVYCVVVTNSNSCSDSDCVGVALDVMGISSANQSDEWAIYPNPASELTVIRYPLSVNSVSKLNIYDTMGRQIYSRKLTGTELMLETVSWNKGVYHVEIISGNTATIKRLIIQ